MATRRQRGVDEGAFSSPACYLHEFQHAPVSTPAHGIAIKRVYQAPERADGYRVLIDRLWPRGISRQRAALDAWLTELAPQHGTAHLFPPRAETLAEFARRYRAELRAQAPLLQTLRQRAR